MESTKEKIKTHLEPLSCQGDCCDTYEKLGPHCLEKESWKSNCPCRSNNLECNYQKCKCSYATCKNRAVTNKQNKLIETDVVERYSWGIDLYTFRNLLDLLPENFSEDVKSTFIEKKLLKSLSKLNQNGYDLHLAFENIMKKVYDDETYNDNDVFFASHLYNLFNKVPILKKKTKAYSKGVGMFCNKKEGISENEFITGYYGEIYPPWYWYEKQDLIKSEKLDKELPDFYNIMLERLKCDKLGYDVIVVDPNSKGNFASRMSHSCSSNCNTVPMATTNEYLIGMYATKNIEYGEELTFNYNSVTEKKKEYLDAICLCGNYLCRGYYLIFAESMILTEVLAKHHNFLHRNYILLKACAKEKELSEQDENLLNKYSIKLSILGGAPLWLKKWTALILEFIDYENKVLPEMLLKEEMSKEQQKKKKESTKTLNNNDNLSSNSSTISDKKYKENKKRKLYNEDDERIYKLTKEDASFRKKKNGTNKMVIETEPIMMKSLELNLEKNEPLESKSLENNTNEEDKIYDIELNLNNNTSSSNHNITNKDLNNVHKIIPELINEAEYKTKAEFFKHYVKSITDNRIQNLAITIDKVTHVLNLLKIESPPLIPLEKNEVFEYLYIGEESIRGILYTNFKELSKKLNNKGTYKDLNDKILKIISLLKEESSLTALQNNLDLSIKKQKEKFVEISKILWECEKIDQSKQFLCYSALSDMLFLLSKTSTFFNHNNKYKSVESINIQIRKRDINSSTVNNTNHLSKEELDKSVSNGKKSYDKFYIWGQLIGWFKQTVSLS